MTAGAAPRMRLNLQCRPGWVRRVLTRVDGSTAAWGLDAEQRGRLRILLAEILNNIAEHAFAPEAGPAIEGRVTLTIRMEDGHLALRITDTGATMPGGCAPGRPAPMDLTGPDLPEGGFGWGLIHDLSCDIAYARAGPLNILTLCMPL